VWQTIGFLYSAAIGYPQMLGGPAAAVPFLAMVYHHPEAVTSYKRAIEEACPRFKEQMSAEAFAAAWERGKNLDLETAVAEFRAALAGK
jgi:hypothetical protein